MAGIAELLYIATGMGTTSDRDDVLTVLVGVILFGLPFPAALYWCFRWRKRPRRLVRRNPLRTWQRRFW